MGSACNTKTTVTDASSHERTPHLAKRKSEIRVRLLRILVRSSLVEPNLDGVILSVFQRVNVSDGGVEDDEEKEAKGDKISAHVNEWGREKGVVGGERGYTNKVWDG